MQVGDGLKTILDRVEFHQSHVLLVGIAEDLHRFDFPILAEDLVKRILTAYLLLQ